MKNCHTATSANNSSLEVFKITGETGANWIELYLKFNNWSDPSGNLFDEEIQVPYLPVYNASLCLIRTLIFDHIILKKKISR